MRFVIITCCAKGLVLDISTLLLTESMPNYVVNELDNTITTLRRVPVCVKDRRSSGSATSPCVWEDVGSVKSESSARMSVGSHSANYKFLNAQKVEEAGVS